ncbi:hypothetical protein DPMN_128320 [Dreissena polymorpha]|uniref:Uncharacterized protein n=1 Tax=Dreissena polymorpha TaxID=45954 RepID=A0A9D4JVM4_DREPO|nr:hypothetical protein DPMN_128320 [Dreissena polymorpha]
MNATLAKRTLRVQDLREINRPTRFIFAVSLTGTVWIEQHVNASVFLLETDIFAIFESAIEGEYSWIESSIQDHTSVLNSLVNKDTVVFQYFAIFNSLQVRNTLRQSKVPWFTTSVVPAGDTIVNST